MTDQFFLDSSGNGHKNYNKLCGQLFSLSEEPIEEYEKHVFTEEWNK